MDEPKIIPFLMRRVPFFILAALMAPVALVLLVIYWRDLDDDLRFGHLIFSIILSLFFVVDLLPRGMTQTVLLAFTITCVWFITYIVFRGKKRARHHND